MVRFVLSNRAIDDFVAVRALMPSDTPTLAIPLFKLKTVGEISFFQQDLGHEIHFRTLCGQVLQPALMPLLVLFLLYFATNFFGHSSDVSSALNSSVVGRLVHNMPIASHHRPPPWDLPTLYKNYSV